MAPPKSRRDFFLLYDASRCEYAVNVLLWMQSWPILIEYNKRKETDHTYPKINFTAGKFHSKQTELAWNKIWKFTQEVAAQRNLFVI